jgi:acyl carrier protein
MGTGLGVAFSMDVVTDLTLREIGLAASRVLGRVVEVTDATHIGRDLAVDSLALMNIILELEDHFDISIPLDRLASVETAGDLSNLVTDLRSRA